MVRLNLESFRTHRTENMKNKMIPFFRKIGIYVIYRETAYQFILQQSIDQNGQRLQISFPEKLSQIFVNICALLFISTNWSEVCKAKKTVQLIYMQKKKRSTYLSVCSDDFNLLQTLQIQVRLAANSLRVKHPLWKYRLQLGHSCVPFAA